MTEIPKEASIEAQMAASNLQALGCACPAAFFDGWREVQRDPDAAEIVAALFELRAELNR